MNFDFLGLSVFAILLFFIFILLMVNYFILLSKNDSRFKWIIFCCRLTTLLLLMILILNPWLNWKSTDYSNSDLNVYLDNSRSISLIDSSVDFNNSMRYINDWGTTNKVNVNWYLFGDSTRKFTNKEHFFSDNYSSLIGVKKNILLNSQQNHLIITDGHINRGMTLDDVMIKNDNIYIAGFGPNMNEVDCYISSISGYDSKSDTLNLSINLGCNNILETAVNASFILSDYKGNIIFSKEKILNFNKSSFQDIALENIDRSSFSMLNAIELKTNLKESNSNNNFQYFTVNNNEKKDMVLMLTGALSNNTKFIKKVIKNKFPNVKIDHYLDSKSINYDLLKQYSMIVLDNFPSSNNNLDTYKYIINNFSDIPIIYFEGPGLSTLVAEKIALSLGLNVNNRKSKKLKLEIADNYTFFNNIDFNKFSPVNKNMLWSNKDESNELITYYSDKSLAAIKNNQLSAVFISNLFSLSLTESNLFNTSNISDYVYNILLNEQEVESGLIEIDIDDFVHTNKSYIDMEINISEKLSDAKLYVNINNLLDNSINEQNLIKSYPKDNIYKFSIDDPGYYRIQISSKLKDSNFTSNEEYIVIDEFDLESQFLYQNKKSLNNFKMRNSAIYFDFDNLEENLNKITINRIIDIKQSNFNSLSTQYYWVLFIFLLALEWYLRKKSKLL